MHCHAELRLSSPGQLKAARRRYKTFMIDEILSKETCDYFEKLSLYSVCPSLVVRPKPLHSCTGKNCWEIVGCGTFSLVRSPLLSNLRARGTKRFLSGVFARTDPPAVNIQKRSVCNPARAGTAPWMGDKLRPSSPGSGTPL